MLAAAAWIALIKKGTFLFFPEPIGNTRLKNGNIPIFPR
jgi:hypothetical protein